MASINNRNLASSTNFSGCLERARRSNLLGGAFGTGVSGISMGSLSPHVPMSGQEYDMYICACMVYIFKQNIKDIIKGKLAHLGHLKSPRCPTSTLFSDVS